MAQKNNGHASKLDEALASLIQTQATLSQTIAALNQSQTAFQAEMAELRRQSDVRFARIASIPLDHSRILQSLPEAVLEKIGFKLAHQP